jgi:hypothetical protein
VNIEIFTQILLQIRLRTVELQVQEITLKHPGPCCTYTCGKYGGLLIQCIRKVAVHVGYSTMRYAELVVIIDVAIAVCCCFTVFSF